MRISTSSKSCCKRVGWLVFLFVFFFSCLVHADLLLDLEAGNFTPLEKLIEKSKVKNDSVQSACFQSLGELYRGNLEKANEFISKISTETLCPFPWLKSYLKEVLASRSEMEISQSEHFILRTKKTDKFLAGYALDALEKAYQEIGKDLAVYPQGKIQVEIYPTQEEFSQASTLSKEILDRSGAIGICKFRRLMILSPEQLAFGYRWLDTLAHEYTHYLINILSSGKCPLWLHEGIAKYLETRWRLKEPEYLTPGNRTELLRAVRENALIPFSRMAPSMVYLKDQTEVRQAFSEVSHAIDFALRKQKLDLEKFLVHFSSVTQEEAFYASMGINFEQFEKDWKNFLEQEKLEESPGAMPDKLKWGQPSDELEELVSVGIRSHIRLGDRMRQNGQLQAALIQYERALKQEPSNPVALTKSARVLITLKREDEVIERLDKCIKENPNYSPGYLVLSEQMVRKNNFERARFLMLEANAINPFNPAVHRSLSKIYEQLGDKTSATKESEFAAFLANRAE